MTTDTALSEASQPPVLPSLISNLVGWDESETEPNAIIIASPTTSTVTPVITSNLWNGDSDKYTFVTETVPIYTPISVNASGFDIDIVYAGATNSGMPASATYLPLFTMSGQAVSDALLKMGMGMLVASFAISTPFTGPLETQFTGVDTLRHDGYYTVARPDVGNLRSKSAERFARTLKQMIRAEPVVDGYDHPAEGFLQDAFQREPGSATQWFGFALREMRMPSLVADSLRLLGRVNPAGREWRSEIVLEGLRSSSAEVRDAAMQAIESWGDPALAELLKSHQQSEPAKWLREYAQQIIHDLVG